MTDLISAPITLRPVGELCGIAAELVYSPADPYAVYLVVNATYGSERVVWALSRDLLAAGLNDMAGYADVRVWPRPNGERLAIALSSPHGRCLLDAPRDVIVRFLRHTLRGGTARR